MVSMVGHIAAIVGELCPGGLLRNNHSYPATYFKVIQAGECRYKLININVVESHDCIIIGSRITQVNINEYN